MAFLESPRFPEVLARGLTPAVRFATRVVALANGEEQRTRRWRHIRWSADAASAVQTMADLAALEAFFYAVGGRTHGFRVRDPGDHTCAQAAGVLVPLLGNAPVGTAGAGYGVAVYQLAKRYAAGALAYERWVRKPAAGSVTVYRGGSPVTVGAGAGEIALDTTTGRVTFVADQTRSASAHTPGASHVVTLASAFSPNLAVGGRLWLAGVTGTAAARLNGTPLAVSNVAGADITLAVETTGLTASGGTASFFPQPSQTLAWAGTFDVPVRFDTDQFDRQMLARQISGEYIVQAVQIPLLEVRADA